MSSSAPFSVRRSQTVLRAPQLSATGRRTSEPKAHSKLRMFAESPQRAEVVPHRIARIGNSNPALREAKRGGFASKLARPE